MGVGEDKLPSANLPTRTEMVNGVRYTITRMDWWGAQEVIGLFERVVGPSLSDVMDDESIKLDALLDSGAGGVVKALCGLIRRATGEDGRKLQDLFGSMTMVEPEGTRRVFLDHAKLGIWFAQRPADLVPWMRLCLEVQIWDFIGPAKDALGLSSDLAARAAMRATAKGSDSPSI